MYGEKEISKILPAAETDYSKSPNESDSDRQDWHHSRHESRNGLEGYKNRQELANQYRVPIHTMRYIINSIDKETLGTTEYVKPGTWNGYAGGGAVYSPEQQDIIGARFEAWSRKNEKAVIRRY